MAKNKEKGFKQSKVKAKDISSNKNNGGVSWMTVFIAIITTAFVTFVVYKNLDNIKEKIGGAVITETQEGELFVSKQVELEGKITPDGDVVTHTHNLHTIEYGTLGLNSKTINLNSYEGDVLIEGVVEKLHGDMFIIQVDKITEEEKEDIVVEGEEEVGTGEEKEIKPIGLYIKDANVYLPEDFFYDYTLINSGDNNKITVKGNTEITVDYFVCNASNPNKNCEQLLQTFTSMAPKSFTTADGVEYVKQPEVNSWYVNNNNLWGYFINDANEPDVLELSKYLIMPNKKFFDREIRPNIDDLCNQDGIKLKEITDYTLSIESGDLVAKVNGINGDNAIACKLKIDPENKEKAVLLDIDSQEIDITKQDEQETKEENEDTEEDTKEVSVSDEDFDTTVEQFPINLEKTLDFTSNRGHKIIFPSKNLAFEGLSTSTNLNQDGVHCFSQMDIIAYPNAEFLHKQPTVKIYECTVKDGFQENKRQRLVEFEDKSFVVEIVDPSWKDFADNVVIKLQ